MITPSPELFARHRRGQGVDIVHGSVLPPLPSRGAYALGPELLAGP